MSHGLAMDQPGNDQPRAHHGMGTGLVAYDA